MSADTKVETITMTVPRGIILVRGLEFVVTDHGYPRFTDRFEQALRFGRVEDCVSFVRTFQNDLAGCKAVSFDTISLPGAKLIPIQDLVDREDQFERERAALYAKYGKALK